MPRRSVTQMAKPLEELLPVLAEAYPTHPMSEVTEGDPYKVLVACIMSLRTRDDTTMPLAAKLFKTAPTPERMIKLSVSQIEKAIYPVSFYRNKAQQIFDISQRLIDEFDGQVPDDLDTLLSFKGVGRKTANLVVSLGHNKPGVCVDVHVHRICNRLGYIETRTPEETEMAIRAKLHERWWQTVNRVLVRHGQECCKPVTPLCEQCPVEADCQKLSVKIDPSGNIVRPAKKR